MPNRIIKESICVSDSVDKLSWFEEILFYRLIVNCDDYGRFDGRIPVIKNMLFPLKDDLPADQVKAGLCKLADVGLIALYESDGRPYLYLPTWENHQIVRAKRSKYPEPCENMITSASTCNHLNANVSVIQSNPNTIQIQSESESNSVESDFDQFWAAYPRKVNKAGALKSFKKTGVSLDVILKALENHKRSAQWKKDGGAFIPHPTTWLNQRRWEETLPGDPSVPKGASGTLGEAELAAIRRVMQEEV